MKKALKLLRSANAGLSVMDHDVNAIVDHATLLCVLTASPDAEGCLDQMNRVLWLINAHAKAIDERRLVAIGRVEKALAKLEEAEAAAD